MNKINLESLKIFFKKKQNLYILLVSLFCVVLFFVLASPKPNNVNVAKVDYVNLSRSVRATGQVISNTDLNLSFNKLGIVKSIKIKVGDVVLKGQILANLDQGQALSAVTESQGKLLSAKAKYKKIQEGSSNEEIALAEVSLKNAQIDLSNTNKNQDVLVSNAYNAVLNSSLAAFSSASSDTAIPPTISGTYLLSKEGDIKISVNQGGGAGNYFVASGILDFSGPVSTTNPQAIGDSGLYIQFPTNYSSQSTWIISIPNKKAPNYLTNLNAYKNILENKNSAISSAQSLVDEKQAELNLKKAVARNADLDIAQADVLAAQGSLESAQSNYEDTIIRAPEGGTITKVDIKYGELAQVAKPVIVLEDLNNLYIEALINEANIAYLKLGQNVNITFDAFGKDKQFKGTISEIDPSSETNDGVVNYKIKVALESKDKTIRPGMNANIDISAGEKPNVLAIPNIAIIKKGDKSFVNLITDDKNKKYTETEVKTGFIGDSNQIEIISGLKQNDQVALTQ